MALLSIDQTESQKRDYQRRMRAGYINCKQLCALINIDFFELENLGFLTGSIALPFQCHTILPSGQRFFSNVVLSNRSSFRPALAKPWLIESLKREICVRRELLKRAWPTLPASRYGRLFRNSLSKSKESMSMDQKDWIGRVVELVSGGPPMTVAEISDEGFVCQWFDDTNRLQEHVFKKELLVQPYVWEEASTNGSKAGESYQGEQKAEQDDPDKEDDIPF